MQTFSVGQRQDKRGCQEVTYGSLSLFPETQTWRRLKEMEICFDTCQVAKLKTVSSEKKQQKDMALVTFSSILSTHAVPRSVFSGDWIHIQPFQLENPEYFLISMYCFKPALQGEQSQISPLYSCFLPTAWNVHPYTTPPLQTPSFV